MARMDNSRQVPQMTNPVWAAEALAHTRLIPGGARLDRSAFVAGLRYVEAGTLVFRTLADRDAALATTVTLPGQSTPTPNPTPRIFGAGDEARKGFKPALGPLTPALGPNDEAFIVAFDVIDLQNEPNVELVRPGTLVYENWFWWFFSGATVPANLAAAATNPLGFAMTTAHRDYMLTLLRGRFQCIIGAETETA